MKGKTKKFEIGDRMWCEKQRRRRQEKEADCEKEMHFFKCYINIKGIKLEKS